MKKYLAYLIAGLAFSAYAAEKNPLDVAGPHVATVMPEEGFESTQQYEEGDTSRLALFITDTDSAWLGLVHGLKAIGIPFKITNDYREAVKHKAILAYPALSGENSSPAALKALAAYGRESGTLIADVVLGGGLEELFGFKETVAGRHYQLTYDTKQPEAAALTDDREKTIPIGNPKLPQYLVGTYAYSEAKAEKLATYEDGSAAIIARHFDSGANVYAFGMDLGYLLSKGYNNREEGIARSYVNQYEPSLDTLLRVVKKIYQKAVPNGVTLSTVPDGKSLSVIMTHDLDYGLSVKNAVEYATYEKAQGFRASYMMQTKYTKDWNDAPFWDAESVSYLEKVRALGGDIGSHTVAHSDVMNKFELGTGRESYPEYQPFVVDKKHANGGTVLGELRVSKYLLETALPGVAIKSFRPGHLSDPYSLPQALVATGYRYSSSVTANNSLTHLPFQLTWNRANKQSVDAYEFPISIEDEEAPELGSRVGPAITLARQLSKYGGTMTVLIHPNVVGHKLAFEKAFVAEVKPYAWLGSLTDFGAWWSARDKVSLDIHDDKLTITVAEQITGLALELPAGVTLKKQGDSALQVRQAAQTAIVTAPPGSYVLTMSHKLNSGAEKHL